MSFSSAPGYAGAFAITTSDTTNLAIKTKAIYVGGTGDIAAIVAGTDGTLGAVTFKAVPVGTVPQIAATRVNATNTTATNLVALY